MNVIRLEDRLRKPTELDKIKKLFDDGYINLGMSDLLGLLMTEEGKPGYHKPAVFFLDSVVDNGNVRAQVKPELLEEIMGCFFKIISLPPFEHNFEHAKARYKLSLINTENRFEHLSEAERKGYVAETLGLKQNIPLETMFELYQLLADINIEKAGFVYTNFYDQEKMGEGELIGKASPHANPMIRYSLRLAMAFYTKCAELIPGEVYDDIDSTNELMKGIGWEDMG